MTLLRASALAVGAATAFAAVACSTDVGGDEPLGRSQEALGAPKQGFCTIPVEGRGKKAMETDYIPHVITCENGGANLEALKAQAIAARSVAYYSMLTKGSICDSQGCQVYGCGATPSERAKRAARETAGMYLSHGGTLTYGFYVAGDAGASAPGCADFGGSTSHYVTYNWGKTGKQVEQTALGYIGAPGFGQNRGCMSQWGARCLENERDFDYQRILRFYYGQDITISRASGPCVVDDKTLRAKLTKKWSSAQRYRGKHADYVACAGQPFEMTYSFKNSGSATWREVKHRGEAVGSDVFLVTADGKVDALTGNKRFSLQSNANAEVRGDHKAKNCISKDGCRKTRFIAGGMPAVAPKKPGIYRSRWRLRDYSKHWGKKSHGFGPKVELRVKVVSCQQKQDECGCRAWCSDGKTHKLAASIQSADECKSVAQTFCGAGKYLDHGYSACAGGESPAEPDHETETETGAESGTGSGGSPPSSPGVGGASGAPEPQVEAPSAEAEDEAIDNGLTPDEGPDGEEDQLDEEDDADFADDGFDGNEDGGVVPLDQGCALGRARLGRPAVPALSALLLLWATLVRRRKSSKQVH